MSLFAAVAATILCSKGACGLVSAAVGLYAFFTVNDREQRAKAAPPPASRLQRMAATAADVALIILAVAALITALLLVGPRVQNHLPGITSAGY